MRISMKMPLLCGGILRSRVIPESLFTYNPDEKIIPVRYLQYTPNTTLFAKLCDYGIISSCIYKNAEFWQAIARA